MSNHEFIGEHAAWEGAIVGLVYAAEQGLIPAEQVVPVTGQACAELMQQGILQDLGELQAFLRRRDSIVQLVAQPFDVTKMPDPRTRCVDLTTLEPKGHFLMVSVSGTVGSEADERLQELCMSHEVNEATLSRDTGFLVI